MSILKSLVTLQNAVDKAVKRDIAKEVEQTLFDGFVDWSNTTMLLADVGLSDLLDAKQGGDIFGAPKSLYFDLITLMEQMEDHKANRMYDVNYYAEITGQTLDSVLKHKADTAMKPVRAKDSTGAYIFPLLKKTQDERNAALNQFESARNQLSMVAGSIQSLSKKEQDKLKPVLVQAREEIADLKSNYEYLQSEVDSLVDTYKEIEDRFAYTLNSDGKRVYPKNDFNIAYSKLIAGGRTTLAKLGKYLSMFMLESELPNIKSDYKRALSVFNIARG